MSLTSETRKSYSKLAQIYNALRKDFTHQNIQKILSKEGNIDGRIPSHSLKNTSDSELSGGTALHIALSHQNSQVFDELLSAGADYTIKNDDGLTPLHYIATSYFPALSNEDQLLIQPFIDTLLSAHVTSKNYVNPRNNDGLSHLHIACMVNHTDAVKLFLESGEDVNQTVNLNAGDDPGFTPLHFAVRCDNVEIAKILLNHGANVSLMDGRGRTPLHILLELKMNVSYTMCLDILENEFHTSDLKSINDYIDLLLEKIPRDKLIVDDTGLSRFHIACTSQDPSTVERILENVDDINHSISTDSLMWPGYTGLHFAASCNVETVKMLLTRGADLEAKDKDGVSPFDICLKQCKLADFHAIVSHKQEWKDTLLSDGKISLSDLLSAMQNVNRLKSLLQSDLLYINAHIPATSKLWPGFTPLHLAVTLTERYCYPSEPNLDLVRECLTDGADVTIKDSRGRTPLHLAYRQGKTRVINLLLRSHHVLANPTDEDNLSHLHIACDAQNEVLVENLLVRTGDVNVVYKGSAYVRSIRPGYTPLHIAVANRNLKLMEILMRHGADVNATDFEGCTPIHKTFSRDDKYAELLFSSPTLGERVVDGLSHLHVASANNQVDVVQRLLRLGAEIDGAIASDRFELVGLEVAGCTALHVAVMAQAHDALVYLLERGADVLAKSDDGSTPLSKALDYDFRKSFRHFLPILRADQELQARMERETAMTMLHLACHSLDVDEVKSLLAKGANVNARVNADSAIWAGCTPLHVPLLGAIACPCKSDPELVDKMSIVLLENGADVASMNAEGDTPIHLCFKYDYGLTGTPIRQLLDHLRDFSINPFNEKKVSHFHLACMVNHVAAVEKFLQLGAADVNEPFDLYADKYPGCYPIHLAINARANSLFGSASQLEIVDLLMRHGADVGAEDSFGYIALHNAARVESDARKRVLERILSIGPDINALSIYGETPFEILLSTPRVSTDEIQFFIEHNARINACNSNNDKGYLSILFTRKSCFYYNSKEMSLSAFEAMMKAPDIAKVDEMGRTAMHHIVTTSEPSVSTEEYVRLIERLAKLGCDVDCQDESGYTALHLSTQFGNERAAVALLTCGADLNIVDQSDRSAFSYASEVCRRCDKRCTHRHPEVSRALVSYLQKLQHLGLDVTPLNANLKEASGLRGDVEAQFLEQIEVARGFEIPQTKIVVGDFLRETAAGIDYPYMISRERSAVDEFFGSIDGLGFDRLKGILTLQYRKAVARLRLIGLALPAFRSLLGFPMPELCCEVIFRFLRNADLKNLIESADDNV